VIEKPYRKQDSPLFIDEQFPQKRVPDSSISELYEYYMRPPASGVYGFLQRLP
jgi:hypothetical protein